MKLIEKLKNIPKIPSILLLSASVLYGGCTTSWQTVRKDLEPTGIEKTTVSRTDYKEIQKRIFIINNPYFDIDYKVKIEESLKEESYEIDYLVTKKELEEVLVEKREVTPGWVIIGFPLGGLFLGAFLANLWLAGDLSGGEPSESEEGEKTANLPAIIGGIIGLGIGIQLASVSSNTEKKETKTGRIEYELSEENPQRKLLNDSLIYNNRPAKNINVSISFGSKKGYMKTDDSGLIPIGRKTAEFFGISWTPSKTYLKENMEYFNPLVQQIKPDTMKRIKPALNSLISARNLEFMLETIEKPSNSSEEIENDSKTVILQGYQLTDDAIYGVVKAFIDQEINSHIKTLTFTLKDAISHIPINHANLELKLEAPSKSYLAGKYFTGELKNNAEGFIHDYLDKPTKIEQASSTLTFSVYTPSKILVEAIHPDYYFISGEIIIEKDTKKTAYMVDKGTKVRVETEKGVGRIE